MKYGMIIVDLRSMHGGCSKVVLEHEFCKKQQIKTHLTPKLLKSFQDNAGSIGVRKWFIGMYFQKPPMVLCSKKYKEGERAGGIELDCINYNLFATQNKNLTSEYK